MKTNCIILIALLSLSVAKAQPCLPDGITFSNQAQIDSFYVNYPNCTQIDGFVSISGYDITKLDGLIDITSIGSYLSIYENPSLTSLAGLENLISIGGGLVITTNNSLLSLTGLESLSYIGGDLKIGVFSPYSGGEGNEALSNLVGMNALTTVGKSLQIQYNASLTSLTGLESLNSVGQDFLIHSNPKLNSLNGLEGLSTINDLLSIRENDSLTNLSGLGNLNHINGYLYIADNESLSDLTGLDGLSEIDSGLFLDNNDALINITALTSLSNIGKTIWIAHNDNLSLLLGLDNINPGSISDLSIYDNISLSTCNVQSVCNYMIHHLGTVAIYDNANGCNNQDEVVAACTFGLNDNSYADYQFKIYPNPASTEIIIETLEIHNQIQISIRNLNGQKLNHYQIEKPLTNIDISHLSKGFYFLELATEEKSSIFKVIKF